MAAAGAFAFSAVSAPAAFLTGSAFAVTAALLAGAPVRLPGPLRMGSFAILGVMMGAGITPDALAELAALPLALVGLVAMVAGATAASYLTLRRLGGWRPLEAFCGSIPGNFSLVIAISLERGARMEQVVMAQATRLFILVTLVPFALGGAEASAVRSVEPAGATLVDVAVTFAIAIASSFLAARARLPAPTMLGPLLASSVLSASGLVTIVIPVWLAAAAFVVLGASVAARFSAVRREGLARMALASLASFVVAFAVAMGSAVAVASALAMPLGEVFLAYAPGGLDAMIALTFLLGFDVAFVAMLHAARMILLSLAMPIIVALVFKRREEAAGGAPSPR